MENNFDSQGDLHPHEKYRTDNIYTSIWALSLTNMGKEIKRGGTPLAHLESAPMSGYIL
jgi:hypothetical protein